MVGSRPCSVGLSRPPVGLRRRLESRRSANARWGRRLLDWRPGSRGAAVRPVATVGSAAGFVAPGGCSVGTGAARMTARSTLRLRADAGQEAKGHDPDERSEGLSCRWAAAHDGDAGVWRWRRPEWNRQRGRRTTLRSCRPRPPRAPVLMGQATQLSAAASDPDGDPLSYSWTQTSPASPQGTFGAQSSSRPPGRHPPFRRPPPSPSRSPSRMGEADPLTRPVIVYAKTSTDHLLHRGRPAPPAPMLRRAAT